MSQSATLTAVDFATDATDSPVDSLPSSLRLHEPTDETKTKKKRVLLLEDDPAFSEIMTDFLKESGFDVAAVTNGVEGVHQVLAGDFEVILCDMMMPTLPGDMFFRAVERMRPHLCDRFVFMSGHRNNQKVNEFVEGVDGTMLVKPFHVDDLLEVVAFIEVRRLLIAA
ncbi:MAG: response regulator [Chthoniobacter sp.]|nr:response regulator [Chthoniobacter sp.]